MYTTRGIEISTTSTRTVYMRIAIGERDTRFQGNKVGTFRYFGQWHIACIGDHTIDVVISSVYKSLT